MYVIQAQNLVKQYKNGIQALNGMNLSVKKGEIFTLLGPNGAGKSTLIKILTTFLKPTSGSVTILDKNLYEEGASIRREIACVSQQPSIDTYLSLEENMLFQSQLYKIPKPQARQQMEALIHDFDLEPYRRFPVSSFSGGVRRRMDIALNMMSNPNILFLDEPTIGLDVSSCRSMWKLMKKIRDDFGTTIFLTTHYLEEADTLSDTICIMKDGVNILQGSPSEMRSYLHQNHIQIRFATQQEADRAAKQLMDSDNRVSLIVRDLHVVLSGVECHTMIHVIMKYLLDHQISFTGIEIVQPTLEDVFLHLTSRNKQEEL